MIEKLKIQDFDTIYDLMEMSFPSDEYRTYDEQKALLNNPGYSIMCCVTNLKILRLLLRFGNLINSLTSNILL